MAMGMELGITAQQSDAGFRAATYQILANFEKDFLR